MSFGFSVSDFITAGKLIRDISSSLRDASEEYQELRRELDGLHQALLHIDKLNDRNGGGVSSMQLEKIKCSALTCRAPLEQFLQKIKKYENTLGITSRKSDGTFKRFVKRAEWAFKKEEVQKLQSYLNIHIGMINMLLLQHGLEGLDMAANRCETSQQDIQDSLEKTSRHVAELGATFKEQGLVVKKNSSMLSILFGVVTSDVVVPLKALTSTVAQICVCAQDMYKILSGLQSSQIPPDARWTFFQSPVKVEDALGRIFPVPSEYSLDQLELLIKHQFREGPGHEEVEVGNYELVNTKNSKQTIGSRSFMTTLLPGMSITMRIVISKMSESLEACPMPQCGSQKTEAVLGGGRMCCDCNVWFDQSSKKRKQIEAVSHEYEDNPELSSSRSEFHSDDDSPRAKRQKLWKRIERMALFKNVCWAPEDSRFTAMAYSPRPSLESLRAEDPHTAQQRTQAVLTMKRRRYAEPKGTQPSLRRRPLMNGDFGPSETVNVHFIPSFGSPVKLSDQPTFEVISSNIIVRGSGSTLMIRRKVRSPPFSRT